MDGGLTRLEWKDRRDGYIGKCTRAMFREEDARESTIRADIRSLNDTRICSCRMCRIAMSIRVLRGVWRICSAAFCGILGGNVRADGMNGRRMPLWVRKCLNYSADRPCYPLVVAVIAFVSTATFSFPFIAVLVPAVLLSPRRWVLIALLTGFASGLGGAVLAEVFHVMGRELVLERYPKIIGDARWQEMADWLQRYGLLALAISAVAPMPQTPAVFLYSLGNPSFFGALLALGVGKTVKYLFLAQLTAHFPERMIRRSV